MLPEISVIVPVYNSEKYLHKCVDSILMQTFTNFELLLIDDGSSDKSGAICDKYAQKDRRVKVFHKRNSGISSARNTGIENASGKYIMFCDNDDMVSNRWMKILYDYIVQFPSALVNCEYVKTDNASKEESRQHISGLDSVTHISSEEYFFLYKNNYSPYIWIRIFRRDIISSYNIRFDENMKKGGEDVLFVLSYLEHCEEFLYIPQPLYYWIDYGSSVSRNYEPKYFDIIKPLYFPRKKAIAEKDRQAFIDEYFFRFFDCFRILEDKRNTMSVNEKNKYGNYIINDSAFIDTLFFSSEAACDTFLKKLLKTKKYRAIKCFLLLRKIKRKVRT